MPKRTPSTRSSGDLSVFHALSSKRRQLHRRVARTRVAHRRFLGHELPVHASPRERVRLGRAIRANTTFARTVPEIVNEILTRSGPRSVAAVRIAESARAVTRLRDEAIRANLPLAYFFVGRFRNSELSTEAARDAAIDALIAAVDRFEPERGFRFSTLAGQLIRWALVDALRRHRAESRTSDGALRFVSIDADPRGDGPRTRIVHRADERESTSPFFAVLARERSEIVHNALSWLPQREARALRLRFGIGARPHTLAELGRVLGVSRSRAHRIERRALERLRSSAELRRLEAVA